jgi:site-specific recombinase XerD
MKPLDAWLADYLQHGRALGRSPVHLRVARFQALAFLRWLRDAHQVATADRLRREHLDAWTKHLAARRTAKGLPLKPASVNKQIESARGLLRWLAVRGVVPSALADALVYVQEPQLLPTSVLPHAQVKKLAARIDTTSAEGFRDRAMLELLYSSGVRAAELLGLDVADVDLANATALVLGKGRKQRVVPIGKTALRFLESYLRGVRPFLVRDPAERALWLTRTGQRLPYHTLLKRIHRHADRLALPVTVTPHTFRRSCTTELIRGGANLWHVKELLGHENLDTLQHYAKLTIADLKKTHARCHPRERES